MKNRRGRSRKDYSGKRYNKLVAKKYACTKDGVTYWELVCDCGNVTVKRIGDVVSGKVKSCKCALRKHGMTATRFWRIWRGMIQRAEMKTPSARKYWGKNYKDVGLDEETWKDFMVFKDDMYDTFLKHVDKQGEDRTTLDRIDGKKGYSKRNCRWATYKVQANNKKTNRYLEFQGKRKTISVWADEIGMSRTGLSDRLKAGLSIEEALTSKKHTRI